MFSSPAPPRAWQTTHSPARARSLGRLLCEALDAPGPLPAPVPYPASGTALECRPWASRWPISSSSPTTSTVMTG